MENQTRFNLNAAIENWRDELAAQPNLASDDRRELETHLRDAIAGFEQRGLNDEESFWLARRRVGQPQQLGEEFLKADPAKVWRERVFWMAFGIMVFWQATLIVSYLEEITLFHLSPSLHGFYQKHWGLLGTLPFLFVGIMLASGRWAAKPIWFLQSRFRLTTLMLLLPIVCALAQLENIRLDNIETGHAYLVTWGVWFHTFFHSLIGYLQISAAPLVFIIWFLPTQNRKTPKRALVRGAGSLPE